MFETAQISAFNRRFAPAIAAGLLVLVPSLLGAIRLAATPTVETGYFLRIVQPSIPQTMKWEPAAAQRNFRLLLDLSGAPGTRKLAAVVWPDRAEGLFGVLRTAVLIALGTTPGRADTRRLSRCPRATRAE